MYALDGPRAKIERAKSEIVTLHASFQGFFKEHVYRVVVAEFDKKGGYHILRVDGEVPTIPNDWGAIIGEIAHNLRSALDGLAWQLALLHTPAPSRDTAFPIYLIGHTTRNVRHFWRKDSGLRLMQSIHRSLWTRIESFQPYKGRNGKRRNPLFLLQELNNADKHRLIPVLATTVGGMRIVGLSGGSQIKIGVPLRPHAKVGHLRNLPRDGVLVADRDGGAVRVQYEVQVDINVTPSIRFGNSCGAVQRLPVMSTLQGMTNEVARVVESFAGEF